MLDWQAIDTVLLDMDGTLLDLHFDSHFWLELLPERYAQHHDMALEQAREWLHERIRREQGALSWYCLDYWTEQLNLPIALLKRDIMERIGFRPGAQAFLQAVQATGRRTVIVTNAHRDSLALKVEVTAIDTLVDGVICSHDFGYPKEDQAFWHALQEVEPFNPQRTLLVDDSLAVLASARRYGIGHLLSITQPDSTQPERQIDEYEATNDFSEVIAAL
ncbi:putative hydrolase of the HAD superfamily [Marinobacterium halophilum]|uniref:Putative hydrolase of the HAD superfamily n=1 Tax=Marinobacterium halophilum TaxID=267374 RepID=A0A2P8EY84_9GAMM|nr:GMP/IMP nucleotidase [Marinobacterium halophilum]PSL14395.1 putative hydrolase of the HAD superfamily [Marinobacterium halophilum]